MQMWVSKNHNKCKGEKENSCKCKCRWKILYQDNSTSPEVLLRYVSRKTFLDWWKNCQEMTTLYYDMQWEDEAITSFRQSQPCLKTMDTVCIWLNLTYVTFFYYFANRASETAPIQWVTFMSSISDHVYNTVTEPILDGPTTDHIFLFCKKNLGCFRNKIIQSKIILPPFETMN